MSTVEHIEDRHFSTGHFFHAINPSWPDTGCHHDVSMDPAPATVEDPLNTLTSARTSGGRSDSQ